jgi:hypothetical protein
MLRLMQTPIPLVIVTMRSKYPMEQVELDGKKTWVRSTELEPIQAEGILNEMFVHGWIDQAHIFHGVKYTVPGVEKAIIDGQPINIATGQRLAAWAKGSPVSSSLSSTAEKAAPSVDASPEVIDGGAAELSDNDQLADDTLEEAARDGMVSLGLAWKLLNKKERATLKSRLDTVHKPVAEMMDAKEGVE